MSTLHLQRSYAEEIQQVAELVFGTMLDAPLVPAYTQVPPPENILTAAIYFAGTWRGAVLLECTQTSAALIANRLMGIDPQDQADDDIRDSLNEIINMIGGNLKAVLPHGVALSMPSVIEGRHYAVRHAASTVSREVFLLADEPLWLTLLEMPE